MSLIWDCWGSNIFLLRGECSREKSGVEVTSLYSEKYTNKNISSYYKSKCHFRQYKILREMDGMLKVKNEVYGTMQLAVSIDVESDKEHMAYLEADMRTSKLDQGRKLNVVDPVTGEIIATLTIHNAEIKWENYFGEGE